MVFLMRLSCIPLYVAIKILSTSADVFLYGELLIFSLLCNLPPFLASATSDLAADTNILTCFNIRQIKAFAATKYVIENAFPILPDLNISSPGRSSRVTDGCFIAYHYFSNLFDGVIM